MRGKRPIGIGIGKGCLGSLGDFSAPVCFLETRFDSASLAVMHAAAHTPTDLSRLCSFQSVLVHPGLGFFHHVTPTDDDTQTHLFESR